MTEKEKMIAGKVYNSRDSELVAALNKSKSLCRQYNNLDFSNVAARKAIIDELLQEEHNDGYCVFTPPFWCDYGFNVKVGKNFYSNHNLVILDCERLLLATMFLSALTADFILQFILLMLIREIQELNLQNR